MFTLVPSLVFLMKCLRSNSISLSLLTLEMASFLSLISVNIAVAKSSQASALLMIVYTTVFIIIEGVLGLTIMVSSAFPKKEEGVSMMTTSKW